MSQFQGFKESPGYTAYLDVGHPGQVRLGIYSQGGEAVEAGEGYRGTLGTMGTNMGKIQPIGNMMIIVFEGTM